MMKHEFEAIANVQVTDEQYNAIEKIYRWSTLNKQDFVEKIQPILDTFPQPEKDIKRMCIRDNSGYRSTPNGCWFHIRYVKLLDIDIASGKYVVENVNVKDGEKLLREGIDLNLCTDFDFDYTDCIDRYGDPVEV